MRGNAEHSLIGWEPVGWGFWLRWTLISLIGFLLSFIGAFALGTLVGLLAVWRGVVGLNFGISLAAALAGVLVGGAIGFVQWLLVRRHLARSGWWILGSAIGAGVGAAVALLVAGAANGPVAWLLGGLIGGLLGGAIIGYLQWRVLQDHFAPGNALWWIGGSAAAWALGLLVIGMGMDSVASGTASIQPGIVQVGLLAVLGAVLASGVTGLVLMRLLRQPAATVRLSARG
jgi:hypothetical protein